MNANGEICIGVAGAGRATELHMNALKRFTGVPICFKRIIARRWEQVNFAKERFGFIDSSLNFDDLLNDNEIDIIDICTPPYAHEEMIIKSLNADKHVICEKPMSGYFGTNEDKQPIGANVSKNKMYDSLIDKLDKLKTVVENLIKNLCMLKILFMHQQ